MDPILFDDLNATDLAQRPGAVSRSTYREQRHQSKMHKTGSVVNVPLGRKPSQLPDGTQNRERRVQTLISPNVSPVMADKRQVGEHSAASAHPEPDHQLQYPQLVLEANRPTAPSVKLANISSKAVSAEVIR